MNWGSAGITAFTSASCQKVIPFILAQGGKDVILLNIRREVIITLARIASSRLMLLVLLTFSWLRL
jgi:hypothetical protein